MKKYIKWWVAAFVCTFVLSHIVGWLLMKWGGLRRTDVIDVKNVVLVIAIVCFFAIPLVWGIILFIRRETGWMMQKWEDVSKNARAFIFVLGFLLALFFALMLDHILFGYLTYTPSPPIFGEPV